MYIGENVPKHEEIYFTEIATMNWCTDTGNDEFC